MKTLKTLGLIVCCSGILMACNNNAEKTTTVDSMTVDSLSDTSLNATGPVDDSASTFMKTAAEGGMMEVEAGKLAETNGGSQAIKDFGALMVKDHTKAGNELAQLARDKNVTLPTELSGAMKSHLEAMRKMTGKAFDKHYMDMMVNDHKSTVTVFENATFNKDADVKAFAEMTLTVIKGHLETAKKLNGSL